MKYFLSFILLSLLSCNFILAQSGNTIRVNAGEDVAQAYSPQGFYRFPQFLKPRLYFKGGILNGGLVFNYNVLSGNMQFINPKGDTLDMVITPDLDSIVFEKNVFLFNGGFLEVVAQSDSLMLLKKLVLTTQEEKIGAYGQPNTTSSIVSVKTYSAGTGVYNLVVNQNIILIENISWFFAKGNTNMIKASKANILKLLPAEKQAIADAYLKKNRTNFDRENDLRRLMEALGR